VVCEQAESGCTRAGLRCTKVWGSSAPERQPKPRPNWTARWRPWTRQSSHYRSQWVETTLFPQVVNCDVPGRPAVLGSTRSPGGGEVDIAGRGEGKGKAGVTRSRRAQISATWAGREEGNTQIRPGAPTARKRGTQRSWWGSCASWPPSTNLQTGRGLPRWALAVSRLKTQAARPDRHTWTLLALAAVGNLVPCLTRCRSQPSGPALSRGESRAGGGGAGGVSREPPPIAPVLAGPIRLCCDGGRRGLAGALAGTGWHRMALGQASV
jgi:hypothetical protein